MLQVIALSIRWEFSPVVSVRNTAVGGWGPLPCWVKQRAVYVGSSKKMDCGVVYGFGGDGEDSGERWTIARGRQGEGRLQIFEMCMRCVMV